MMVVGVWFGSGDMDDGITFGCFFVYLFSSSLLGSRPGTNGVGTGFTTCHCRWSFPVRQIRRKVALCGTDWERDLLIRTSTYMERLFDCFLSFLSLYGGLQPRGSAPEEGDDVTAGG